MGFKNARYNDEAVVITQFLEPFDYMREPLEAARDIEQLMADVPGVIYNILDLTRLKLNFSDLVVAMGLLADKRVAVDPRLRPVLVGTSEMVRLLAAAASQEQYGQRDLSLFASIDEALVLIRSQPG